MAKNQSTPDKAGETPRVADAIESIERGAFEAAVAAPEPAEQKTVPVKKSAEGKPGGFSVYLGPSILGVIQSGTVIADGDEYAQKMKDAAVSKYPLVKALLIPKDRLAADRVKVKTPGTALYENYKKLVAAVKSN